MNRDEFYMARALELARHGELDASPNPMVGAVIVGPDGKIAGEGWHRKCGEAHAEVNAVNAVADPELLAQSTIYVTLEPCAHYGKTPPCAKLLADKRIPRVVVGTEDPFAKVCGKGIAMLREAGAEVTVGVLGEECRKLNRKFFTAHTLHRPYITLKWAMSRNGYIDGNISDPLNRVAVHRLRAMNDAILVGSGTWLADSPSLSTRHFAGKSPKRVILDRRRRLTDLPDDVIRLIDYKSLSEAMQILYGEYGIISLLAEGGREVLQSFIDEGVYDEIRIEVSDNDIDGAVKAPRLPEGITPEAVTSIGPHNILTYTKNKQS